MKRALNNKEKATLKALKEMGQSYELKEIINYKGELEWFANIHPLGWCVSLNDPPDLKTLK